MYSSLEPCVTWSAASANSHENRALCLKNNEKIRLAIRAGWLFSKQSVSEGGGDTQCSACDQPLSSSAARRPESSVFLLSPVGCSGGSHGSCGSFHGCKSKAASAACQRHGGTALLLTRSFLLTTSSFHLPSRD